MIILTFILSLILLTDAMLGLSIRLILLRMNRSGTRVLYMKIGRSIRFIICFDGQLNRGTLDQGMWIFDHIKYMRERRVESMRNLGGRWIAGMLFNNCFLVLGFRGWLNFDCWLDLNFLILFVLQLNNLLLLANTG